MKKNIIELNNVSVIFNNDTKNKITVLDNLSLLIKHEELLIITGGNGSGKTTLLNLIKKSIIPTSGTVSLKNVNIEDINDYTISRYVSTVYQNPINGLCENLTVFENLYFGLKKNNKIKFTFSDNNKNRTLIIEQLKKLKMEFIIDKLDEKIINLSGGQKQLVNLIKITLEKPEILLLDEPTSALDSQNIEMVEKLILTIIKKYKITTLWITHKKILKNNKNLNSYNVRNIKIKKGRLYETGN